ncbi:hypothetical protein PL9631_120003 [Planktothrix paucivesiculata PCC 9631]|uniref:Uncharacterized protein n=1 Tax=Planktothrix paucivesiculata PCC 9631 TaxID=671071 RepID=A0A7Z9BJA6_9CYAN|nr:hypothetical protein PL9631_120003 [Planktothrix paucivesiculata PCC 9631]
MCLDKTQKMCVLTLKASKPAILLIKLVNFIDFQTLVILP